MDVKWVKIRSWHAVKRVMGRTLASATVLTRCGRMVEDIDSYTDDLPAEKSCESCLRIVARLADA